MRNLFYLTIYRIICHCLNYEKKDFKSLNNDVLLIFLIILILFKFLSYFPLPPYTPYYTILLMLKNIFIISVCNILCNKSKIMVDSLLNKYYYGEKPQINVFHC